MPRTVPLFIVSAILFSFQVIAAPVPDTGLTKCYNDTSEIPCPSPDQPFYGQDGNYSINPISYTKLDNNGNPLPDSATSWIMVRDNVTGLIWEIKTNLDGIKDDTDPHDADNIYTWYDSNSDTNGGEPGTPGEGTDTEDFLKALNDSQFGGYSDWRLPTIKELACVVDYGVQKPGPTINPNYFTHTIASWYWTATTYAYSNKQAWLMNFAYGDDYSDNKSNQYSVRAVRGGKSEGSDTGNFRDNGDGTITDRSTGLMWQKSDVAYSFTTW